MGLSQGSAVIAVPIVPWRQAGGRPRLSEKGWAVHNGGLGWAESEGAKGDDRLGLARRGKGRLCRRSSVPLMCWTGGQGRGESLSEAGAGSKPSVLLVVSFLAVVFAMELLSPSQLCLPGPSSLPRPRYPLRPSTAQFRGAAVVGGRKKGERGLGP